MAVHTERWDLERRLERYLPRPLREKVERLDARASRLMDEYGIVALRVALGVVFVWFGVLKVIGKSPVADLVADTAYWLPSDFVVKFMGGWEIVIGVLLIVPVAMRLALLLFWAQMAGTLLVLVVHPGRAFQDNNPLLLSLIGEFVIKNLVLIAAGLVIGSSIRRLRAESKQQTANSNT